MLADDFFLNDIIDLVVFEQKSRGGINVNNDIEIRYHSSSNLDEGIYLITVTLYYTKSDELFEGINSAVFEEQYEITSYEYATWDEVPGGILLLKSEIYDEQALMIAKLAA